MSKITLSIKTLPQVVAGKFVDTFAVVDQDGNLVGSKAHRDPESAEAELGSLKYFSKGLEFARATAPEGTAEKALVGKANTVAAYLIWLEKDGEPEVSEETPEDTVAEEAASEEEDF